MDLVAHIIQVNLKIQNGGEANSGMARHGTIRSFDASGEILEIINEAKFHFKIVPGLAVETI